MKITQKIFLGFLLIYALAFYLVIDFVIYEIRPRYLETIEESLNDTVQIFVTIIEQDIKKDKINYSRLKRVMNELKTRKVNAEIYGLKKTDVNLNVYVTNSQGIVIYDSDNGRREGMDFSKWRDVYLSLKGKYGARSSYYNPSDISKKAIFVSSPLRLNGDILGTVTIVKPEESVDLFISLAKRKVIIFTLLTCIAFMILGAGLSLWISRPFVRLTGYVKSLKNSKRTELPHFRGPEIKELAAAFEEMKDELEGRKYIENYIQSLTHELKSPLSTIRGAGELLTEDIPAKDKSRFLNSILNETERIDKIIEKLLKLSSLENRKKLRDVEDINLSKLAEEIKEDLSPQLEKKGIDIIINVDNRIRIRGERFLIQHSIINLLQNSINHSAPSSSITIEANKDETHVKITVTDQGSGIPDYAEEKIFNKFYSIPSPGSERKGTGLGLAFVKEAVELHGGNVSVSNNKEKGVNAVITLPL